MPIRMPQATAPPVAGKYLVELEDQVRAALARGDLDAVRTRVADERPADVADVLERLSAVDRARVFGLLEPPLAAATLHETGLVTTQDLLKRLPVATVASLLDLLPIDEAAEVLEQDAPARRDALLADLMPAHASHVRDLLHYPPRSAGRLMTEQFVRLRPTMTADEALAHIRRVDPTVETLTDVYIFNADEVLVGVASLRELLCAPPTEPLAQFMTTRVISVTPETDQEQVARLVARYNFLALPVVTPEGRMLGLITVDDVLDVLVQADTEDALRFGGIEAGGLSNQPYFTVPLLRVVRRRVGWLLLLFVAETFTGSVLRLFQDELAQVVALAFFIPLLIGTGGNTGAQTVSTLIRGLAIGDIRLGDTWRVVRRELVSGVLLGLLLGVVAFGRALLWGSSLRLSLVVALTILVICAWANTIGSLIPLVAQRFKIDPAVVSAPLITTLVDATGLAIYLLIAKFLLGL